MRFHLTVLWTHITKLKGQTLQQIKKKYIEHLSVIFHQFRTEEKQNPFNIKDKFITGITKVVFSRYYYFLRLFFSLLVIICCVTILAFCGSVCFVFFTNLDEKVNFFRCQGWMMGAKHFSTPLAAQDNQTVIFKLLLKWG